MLKGLEDVISLSASAPVIGQQGWMFEDGTVQPFEVPHPLYRVYQEHDAHFTGKATVPVLWDKQTRRIVCNESSEIIRVLNSAFDAITGNRLDLYPEHLRPEIDRWNDLIYPGLNNGVYQAGFAKSQRPHEKAVGRVFETLDAMEEHLAAHRYLAGVRPTEPGFRRSRVMNSITRAPVISRGPATSAKAAS